jgi:hypothetical protein
MGETDKIVTPHYTFEKLPEELRRGIESGQMVRVTVEPEEQPAREPRPLHEMYGFAAGLYESQGLDPVDFIRQLRDEWDD